MIQLTLVTIFSSLSESKIECLASTLYLNTSNSDWCAKTLEIPGFLCRRGLGSFASASADMTKSCNSLLRVLFLIMSSKRFWVSSGTLPPLVSASMKCWTDSLQNSSFADRTGSGSGLTCSEGLSAMFEPVKKQTREANSIYIGNTRQTCSRLYVLYSIYTVYILNLYQQYASKITLLCRTISFNPIMVFMVWGVGCFVCLRWIFGRWFVCIHLVTTSVLVFIFALVTSFMHAKHQLTSVRFRYL